jgi:hypothetical protein
MRRISYLSLPTSSVLAGSRSTSIKANFALSSHCAVSSSDRMPSNESVPTSPDNGPSLQSRSHWIHLLMSFSQCVKNFEQCVLPYPVWCMQTQTAIDNGIEGWAPFYYWILKKTNETCQEIYGQGSLSSRSSIATEFLHEG